MTEVLDRTSSYATDFKRRQTDAKGDPTWLVALRESALDAFERKGFPTTDDEDWRFTNLERLAATNFRIPKEHRAVISAADVAASRFSGEVCQELVFVDGQFSPEFSLRSVLADGVEVQTLAKAIANDPDSVRRHLGNYADYSKDAFTALNSAFMDCGAYVLIPKGCVVKGLVHLIFLSTRQSGGTVTHPRNLIVAGESSQAAIVESYVGLGDEVYWTNAVTEIVAGENSVLEHYMVLRDSVNSFNISTLRVQQERNSNFTSHSVLFGGGLVRNNVHPVLNGEGCHSLLNGLYVVGSRQHMDNFMRVEHAKPHGDSRQFYKGIIDGDGHAVFSGRIIVHKDAQKTDAKQTNMNLLLSDKGQVDTKPQLEIYADDVKCTHGATIGQIDADAVFYLRSRGLSPQAARSLLIHAFAGESLGRMHLQGVRDFLERLLAVRLPQGNLGAAA